MGAGNQQPLPCLPSMPSFSSANQEKLTPPTRPMVLPACLRAPGRLWLSIQVSRVEERGGRKPGDEWKRGRREEKTRPLWAERPDGCTRPVTYSGAHANIVSTVYWRFCSVFSNNRKNHYVLNFLGRGWTNVAGIAIFSHNHPILPHCTEYWVWLCLLACFSMHPWKIYDSTECRLSQSTVFLSLWQQQME